MIKTPKKKILTWMLPRGEGRRREGRKQPFMYSYRSLPHPLGSNASFAWILDLTNHCTRLLRIVQTQCNRNLDSKKLATVLRHGWDPGDLHSKNTMRAKLLTHHPAENQISLDAVARGRAVCVGRPGPRNRTDAIWAYT
jgi:hypothetical protein